jgi:hypothetical protein
MWGRIISTVRYDLKESYYIYYYQISLHKSMVSFLLLDKYLDAHHVTDAKQHGQEVLGYVEYAFSG